jgi:hypothetical protein
VGVWRGEADPGWSLYGPSSSLALVFGSWRDEPDPHGTLPGLLLWLWLWSLLLGFSLLEGIFWFWLWPLVLGETSPIHTELFRAFCFGFGFGPWLFTLRGELLALALAFGS